VIPGRPETVVAELGLDPGRLGTPGNHLVGVGLGQGTAGELARAAADSAKQRPLWVVRKPGALHIGREGLLKVVMAGHGVILATLLMEPHAEPSVLSEHVLDFHSQRGADACEAVNASSLAIGLRNGALPYDF